MIKFIEKTHKYVSDSGELISVSAFTDRFKEKVDWKAVAKKVAAKETKNGNPMTAQQVLAKWENKRDVSAAIGTLYHNIRETELINDDNPFFYGLPCETKVGSY